MYADIDESNDIKSRWKVGTNWIVIVPDDIGSDPHSAFGQGYIKPSFPANVGQIVAHPVHSFK